MACRKGGRLGLDPVSRCAGSSEAHCTHTQIIYKSFVVTKHFSRWSNKQGIEYSSCLSTIATAAFSSSVLIPLQKYGSRVYVSICSPSPPSSILNHWTIWSNDYILFPTWGGLIALYGPCCKSKMKWSKFLASWILMRKYQHEQVPIYQ